MRIWDDLENDIMIVVGDPFSVGKIRLPFNSNVISNIPNEHILIGFEKYRTISLCISIYRLISKFISRRLKPILYDNISIKQFRFIDNRNIHDAINLDHEALRSINTKLHPSFMLKKCNDIRYSILYYYCYYLF